MLNTQMLHVVDSEIKRTQEKLVLLKERKKELVESILKYAFWGKINEWTADKEFFTAALYYLFQKRMYSFDTYFQISRWDEKNYYQSWIDKYEDGWGNKSAIKIGWLKDIVNAIDWKDMWMEAVKKKNTIDSLEEFKNKLMVSEKKIQELHKFYENRLHIINCKELSLKDIFIILPK